MALCVDRRRCFANHHARPDGETCCSSFRICWESACDLRVLQVDFLASKRRAAPPRLFSRWRLGEASCKSARQKGQGTRKGRSASWGPSWQRGKEVASLAQVRPSLPFADLSSSLFACLSASKSRRSPWGPKQGDGDGPRSPDISRPDTRDLLKKMRKVDPNQSKRYRQRTGQ